MLREAVCPLIESLLGTKLPYLIKILNPVQAINTPVTHSLSLSLFKIGNWVLSGKLGSTLAVLSEVHHR